MILEGHLRLRKGHFSMEGIFEKGIFYRRTFDAMTFEEHLRFRKGHFSMEGIFEKGIFLWKGILMMFYNCPSISKLLF